MYGGKYEPEVLDELAMLPPPVRFNSRSNSRPEDGKGEVEEETKAIVFLSDCWIVLCVVVICVCVVVSLSRQIQIEDSMPNDTYVEL